jgi:hypothetical protein
MSSPFPPAEISRRLEFPWRIKIAPQPTRQGSNLSVSRRPQSARGFGWARDGRVFFHRGQTRAGKAGFTPHCERRVFYPMARSTIAICNDRNTSKRVKLIGFSPYAVKERPSFDGLARGRNPTAAAASLRSPDCFASLAMTEDHYELTLSSPSGRRRRSLASQAACRPRPGSLRAKRAPPRPRDGCRN